MESEQDLISLKKQNKSIQEIFKKNKIDKTTIWYRNS